MMTEQDEADIERVLGFWFGPEAAGKWFEKDAAFDRRVKEALGEDHKRAVNGACQPWTATARGCLALVILLDQVPRKPLPRPCRGLCLRCAGPDGHPPRPRKRPGPGNRRPAPAFLPLYLPLEHSEDMADQQECCRLTGALDQEPELLKWAQAHRTIIARFGRFPPPQRRPRPRDDGGGSGVSGGTGLRVLGGGEPVR